MQNIIAAAVNLIGAVLVVIGVVGIFKETEGEPKEKLRRLRLLQKGCLTREFPLRLSEG